MIKTLFPIGCWIACLTLLSACLGPQHPETSLDIPQQVAYRDKRKPFYISFLLPLQGELAHISEAIRMGFVTANAQSGYQAVIDTIDTTQVSSIHLAYKKAVQRGARLVVGPLKKTEVQALSQQTHLPIPVLALNYLSNNGVVAPDGFFQFGLSPLDEAKQAAILAYCSGYQSALVLVPEGEWGENVAQVFSAAWETLGGTVVDYLAFSTQPQQIANQLRQLLKFKKPRQRRYDFDVMFLSANPQQGRQIKPLLKFFYAGDIPVYSTALIYSGVVQPFLDRDLDGIIFCDIPWTTQALEIDRNLSEASAWVGYDRYYALGMDAFRIATEMLSLEPFSLKTLIGQTGILSFDEDDRIVRQLPCFQFQSGTPVLLHEFKK